LKDLVLKIEGEFLDQLLFSGFIFFSPGRQYHWKSFDYA